MKGLKLLLTSIRLDFNRNAKYQWFKVSHIYLFSLIEKSRG